MDDPLLVGGVDGPGERARQPGRVGERLWPAAQPGGEVAALDQFHGEEGQVALEADLEDLDDVGVLQPGDDAGLADEAVEPLLPAEQAFLQRLQRHQPVEGDLAGLVHDAHAAAPQLVQHLVAGEGGPVGVAGGRWRGRRARGGQRASPERPGVADGRFPVVASPGVLGPARLRPGNVGLGGVGGHGDALLGGGGRGRMEGFLAGRCRTRLGSRSQLDSTLRRGQKRPLSDEEVEKAARDSARGEKASRRGRKFSPRHHSSHTRHSSIVRASAGRTTNSCDHHRSPTSSARGLASSAASWRSIATTWSPGGRVRPNW